MLSDASAKDGVVIADDPETCGIAPAGSMTSPSPAAPARGRASGTARFAWGLLGYEVLVVAWGAYVRASGSGAGCGRHWPMCNGEIIPRAPRIETLIELSHRLSSGGALVGTLVLLALALRAYPRGHRVRRGAWTTALLMLAEALIGAGLVLFELVAHDASMKRALSISLHLVNTFFLLGSTAVTAWWASGGGAPRARGQRPVIVTVGGVLVAMLFVGAAGAVTALGDTLFPSPSLAAGIAQDFAAGAHLFVRLRAIHPMLAVTTAAAIAVAMGLVRAMRPSPAVRSFSRLAAALAAAQVGAGLVDVLTRAPIAMQIVHLLLADSVWIALVLTGAAALAAAPADTLTRV
jgi:heme A synthase